jgi:putative peptidoglycan lipid II flippase
METQNRGIELALFLTLPATIAFVVAAEPIVRGLFQHGQFTAEDTARCAWALSAFSVGLPAYVLVKVLTPGFFAREDTRTPMRFATISVGVNLVLNLALIPLIKHVGPPLATAIASTVNVWMLYHALGKRGHFAADAQLRRRIPRLALAAVLMGAALFAGEQLLDPYLTGTIWMRFAALSVLVGAGGAIYVVACFVTRAYRLSDLKALIRRKAQTAPKE